MDKFTSVPLYIQLKNELIQKIKNEQWKVDEKIPTEMELMKKYDIGRDTVRKALGILVQEGYVYKKRGIGTFVSKRHISIGYEPLISLSNSLNARGLNEKNLVLEKKEIIPDGKLADKIRWPLGKNCFYVKRLRYIEEKPLAIEKSYFSQEFSNNLSHHNFESSIAKYLLEELKIKIQKIEHTTVLRFPNEEEARLLDISTKDKILDLDRWIYTEGAKDVFYYVHFLIPINWYNPYL